MSETQPLNFRQAQQPRQVHCGGGRCTSRSPLYTQHSVRTPRRTARLSSKGRKPESRPNRSSKRGAFSSFCSARCNPLGLAPHPPSERRRTDGEWSQCLRLRDITSLETGGRGGASTTPLN